MSVYGHVCYILLYTLVYFNVLLDLIGSHILIRTKERVYYFYILNNNLHLLGEYAHQPLATTGWPVYNGLI